MFNVNVQKIVQSFCKQRKPLTKWKDNLLDGRKHLQMIWLIRNIQHIIYKQLIQLNIKKQPNLKMGRNDTVYSTKPYICCISYTHAYLW